MALYLPVLYGTTREGRVSIHVAQYAVQRLARRPGVETRLFDPRDLPLGNLVLRQWERRPPVPAIEEFSAEMSRADGFLIVTPEYNYGMPGALKNMIDHLYKEWNRKPFAFVGAGGLSGGLRAIDQLRQVVSGIGAITVPTHLAVHQVAKAFGPEGPLSAADEFPVKFDRLFDELEWYARALKAPREAVDAGAGRATGQR
ncbi:MAG: NAD(P)H-dependent oxidoreductase [Thermoplasmata archaeon]|nr:NAD(P)H-dependent oxidoreductase [Thermoplasmata archaeon]